MPPMAGAISFVYLTGSRNLLEALRPSRRLSGINTEHFAGKFWVLAQSMALCARRSHCRSLSRARNHFTDPGPKFGMLTNSSSVVSRRSPIVFSPANFTAFRIRVGKRTISTRVSFGRSGPRSNILQPTHLAFSPARFAIAALHRATFFMSIRHEFEQVTGYRHAVSPNLCRGSL